MSAGKLLHEIARRMDFQIDKDSAYGVCNEILCSVEAGMNSVLIKAYTGPLNETQRTKLRIFLLENKKDYSIKTEKSNINKEYVTVLLEKVFIKAETGAAFAEDLAMYIHQLGVTCSCDICRSRPEFFNSSVKDKVCDKCFLGYNRRQVIAPVRKIKKEDDGSGSYVTGFIGALLGAVIGMIPWALSNFLAFFMPLLVALIPVLIIKIISAMFAAKLTNKGYMLFNGKTAGGSIPIFISAMLIATFTAVLTFNFLAAAIAKSLGGAFEIAAEKFFGGDIFEKITPKLKTTVLSDFLYALVTVGAGIYRFLKKYNAENVNM